MTKWNFRIIRHDLPNQDKVWFGVHEVFYRKGKIWAWSNKPVLVTPTKEELLCELNRISDDLARYPDELSENELITLSKNTNTDGEESQSNYHFVR